MKLPSPAPQWPTTSDALIAFEDAVFYWTPKDDWNSTGEPGQACVMPWGHFRHDKYATESFTRFWRPEMPCDPAAGLLRVLVKMLDVGVSPKEAHEVLSCVREYQEVLAG